MRKLISALLVWAMVMSTLPVYASDQPQPKWGDAPAFTLPANSRRTEQPRQPELQTTLKRITRTSWSRSRLFAPPGGQSLLALNQPLSFDLLKRPFAGAPSIVFVPMQLPNTQLQVSVGFADSNSSSANFPEPWNETNPAISFTGGGKVYRAGAVRLDNPSGTAVTVDSVTVDLGRPGPVFQLWSNITVPANGSAILTQTTDGNFNTSASPLVGCGQPLGANETRIPKVTVTIGGQGTDYLDSAHVLDTGGFDSSCRGNQSLQWRAIGTVGLNNPSGSIQLAAENAPHAVGTQNTLNVVVNDANNQSLANVPVNVNVVNGPNKGQTFPGTTDGTGTATIQYSSAAQGTDLLQASVFNVSGGVAQSQQAPSTWTSADACPPATTPNAAASQLIYIGQTTAVFGNPVRLAALLTDGTGNPLAGETISVTVDGQTTAATTDGNGMASTTVSSLPVGTTSVTVSFAGDQNFQPAQASTQVTVQAAPTLLRYTGANIFASLGQQTVTALLTDEQGRTPIVNRTVTFVINGTSVSGVTNNAGIATAAFNFQTAQTPGQAQLQINFAGDADYQASSRTVTVEVFQTTGFVIWGGNSGGLKIGQQVNFWGAQWANQVTGGQWGANPSFKGFADTVETAGIQQCEPTATTSTLDTNCWTTKPGDSFPLPPATLANTIQVIVATAINKSGSSIFGNISCGVVLQVSANPPYGNDPGHPGFGTILAVNGDCAGVFPQPAALTASQQQPSPVLPGQQASVSYNIANQGSTDATSVTLTENFDQLTPSNASANVGTVGVGQSASGNFPIVIPTISGRQSGESSVTYESRLAASDGRLFTSEGEIKFTDPFAQLYPPVDISSFSLLNLPRLEVGVSGASCIAPGTPVTYPVRVENVGSATAQKIAAALTLPDNSIAQLTIPDLASGTSFAGKINWQAPGIAAKGANESTQDYLTRLATVDGTTLPAAVISATWQDQISNSYGPVEQPFTSLTQRVPIVSTSVPATSSLLPNQKTQFSFTASNTGSGNAVQVTLTLKRQDGSLLTIPNFSLPGGQSGTVTANYTAPTIAPKGATETDSAYFARLTSTNGTTLNLDAILNWTDPANNNYGPTDNPFTATEVLPILTSGTAPTATALPGQNVPLTFSVSNSGSTDAQAAMLTQQGSAQTIGTIPAGKSQSVTTNFAVPTIAAKGASETDAAYVARLQSFDNHAIPVSDNLNWADSSGNKYGPVAATAQITEQVPILGITLSGPASANAGDAITYTITLTNSGHGPATIMTAAIMTLSITLPDGSVQHPVPSVSALAPGASTILNVNFTIPGSTSTGPATATATTTWLDANTNSYGPVSAAATTQVTQANQPPVVNAGPNQTITLPTNTVTLNGTATDDGKPAGILNITWSEVSGPAPVTFSSPNTAVTQATFTTVGTYVLRLTASDTQRSSSSDVTVIVKPQPANQPPVVSAGPGGEVTLPNPFKLNGSATDDGLPVGKLIIQWSEVSGPSTAVFADPTQPVTTVTFDSPGTYVLRLTANDTQLSSSADATVIVLSNNGGKNQPPFVDAGPDQTIVLPNPAVLNGTALDDGLPNGTLLVQWSKLSGPGNVVFANASVAQTTATFSIPGDYVLQLSASDTQLVSNATVHITVGELNGTRSSRGNEFWLMFDQTDCDTCATASLFITSETNASGTVTVPGINFSKTFSVGATQIVSIDLPTAVFHAGFDSIQHLGIHVVSDHEITVYGVNFEFAATDAYLGLPVSALGTEYINASYSNVGSFGAPTEPGTQFGVVAAYDNTTVTVTPSANANGRTAGVPYSFVLHQGRTYQLQTNAVPDDLTGTIISADKPIAVFGSHRCADILSLFCNHLVEQLPSTDTWGTHFVTVPLSGRQGGDEFRFIGATDGTNVSINGQQVASINRGDYYETRLKQPSYITSDKPVLVVQYSTGSGFGGEPGDPFMIVIPPVEQFRAAYTVSTVEPTQFKTNFINVIVPTFAKGQLQLDGAAVASSSFTDVAGSGFSTAQLSVSTGAHRLIAPAPFGVFSYGFAEDDGYGYTGGIALPGVPGGSIGLFPATSTQASGTQACFVASVADGAQNPLSAINVNFFVTGANAQTGSVDTDGNGQAQFCYSGNNAGTDNIMASIETAQASSTVTFQANAANQAPQVSLPTSLSISLPDSAKLIGIVTDDGLPLGGGLTFTWSQVSGPGTTTFSNAATVVTTASFSDPGDYVLQLSASDSALSGSATTTVHVSDSRNNQAPVIGQLPTQTVDFGSDPSGALTLSPTVTDDGLPVGSKLAYTWTVITGDLSKIVIQDPTAASTPIVITDTGANQSFVLQLTVDDSRLTSTMNVTVNTISANKPPSVATGGGGSITLPTNTFTFNGTVTDDGKPVGGTLTIQWTLVSGPAQVTFSNPNAAVTTVTFPNSPGFYTFQLSANDGELTTSALVSVNVNPANQPPQIRILSITPSQFIALPANTVTINASVTDDGLPSGTLNINWILLQGPAPVTFSTPNQASTQITFTVPGNYIVELRADDTQLRTSQDVFVQVTPQNQAPVVSAGPNQSIILPANTLTLFGSVQDDGLPSGKPVTQQWSEVSGPATVTFSAPTSVTTNATFTTAGTYDLRLTASDTQLTGSADVIITVLSAPQNLPPVVSAGLNQTVTLPAPNTTVTVFLNGNVKDDGLPAGKPVTQQWSEVSGPAPVTFLNATVPQTFGTFNTAGVYDLRLTASDTQLTSSADVFITVNPPVNRPPSISVTAPSFVSLPTTTVTLNGTVTDDGLPNGTLTTQWTQLSGPVPATFSAPTSPVTQVTMPAAGNYAFQLSASDSQLVSNFTVGIQVVADQPPRVSISPGVATITLPQNTLSLTATGFDDALPSGQLQFQWSQNSGPAQVTFSNPTASFTGVVANVGTPTTTQVTFPVAGTYVLQCAVSDTQLIGTNTVQVNVNPEPPPLVVKLFSPGDGDVITQPVSVTGSVSSPGTWKLEYALPSGNDGSTPTFIQFASGTGPQTGASLTTGPTLGTFDPTVLLNGIYTIRLTATDTTGTTGTASVTVTVNKNAKLGNLVLPFNDLTVPVPGLPIQILRTYDSRDKQLDDFGFGWSLGMKNVRLQKNRNLGKNWNETQGGGGFGTTFCLDPNDDRIVTITFPDGRVYEFSTGSSPECQQIEPITGLNFQFTQIPTVPGTAGATLQTADGAALFIDGSVPGPENIIDTSGSIYNPTLFQLKTAEGFTYIIDQNFGVTSVTDPSGNKVTIGPNGITSSTGLSVTFVRDAQNRITQITDATGTQVLKYSYNSNGDLQSFTDAPGNLTRYTYGFNHQLASINDPRNINVLIAEYDGSGHLTDLRDGNGAFVQFTNNTAANQETIKDRLGNPTTYTYDNDGNVISVKDALGNVTTSTYDANDNKLTDTDALGKTTTYTYDSANNKLTQTDPLGNVSKYSYNGMRQVLTITDPLGHITTNTYDANGNLLSTKDALGNVTSYTYNAQRLPLTVKDALGNITTLAYDVNERIKQQTDSLGNVSNFTYDANGNRLTQAATRTKADGTKETLNTQYQYDANNRLVKTINSDGSITQVVYNPSGTQSDSIDVLGHKTHYDYDNNGRLTKTTYQDGTAESITYDANGNRLTSTDRANRVTSYAYDALNRLTETTYPDGSTAQTVYDAAGRAIKRIDALGNVTQYGYDDVGRRTSITDALGHVTSFTYDAAGNQLSMTDALNHTVQFVYDASNRRVQTINPDKTTESFSYDAQGRQISKTDQAGKTTQYGYDALGRLTSVTDALGQITQYSYDELGNRISQTDANSHTTSFAYDQLGHRISRTLPAGMSESYTYDAAGNMTSSKDFNGHTTTYAYDTLNRLLSKTADTFFSTGACSSGACGATQVSYTYTATGQRATMSDFSGITAYTYDKRDRLLTKANPFGTLTYTYDAAGNMLSLKSSNAGGASMTYGYDTLNRLTSVQDTTGTTSYSFDAIGNLSGYTYPNGIQTSYTYNTLNHLTKMQSTCGTGTGCGSPSTPLASYTYTLGAAGNRLSVAELSGRTVQYGYDDLYRLTLETIAGAPSQNGTINYTYDAVGNRKQLNSTVAAIPSGLLNYDANDRLSTDGYDANGNTINNGGVGNVYDFENHMVKHDGVLIAYDGDGNRVQEAVAGVTTSYLVADSNLTGYAQVVDELQNGTVSRTYSYGLFLISQKLVASSQQLSFYGFDGHGSVRFLTDATGAVTDTYDYDAFGNLISSSGTTPNNYLFAGEQFDPSLGIYYNRARYYDERSGRFWTMDTWEGVDPDPLSLHKFLYAQGNPVDHADPSGRQIDELASAALSMTLDAMPTLILSSPLGNSVLSFVASLFIPPYVRDGLAYLTPDAATFGVSASGNIPLLKGSIGFGFGGGMEFLRGFHTGQPAVYFYLGGGANFGPNTKGFGEQVTAGLVFNCPNSQAYTKRFVTFTFPFKAFSSKIRSRILGFISNLPIPSADSLGLSIGLGGIIDDSSVNLFFDPSFQGSWGVSFGYTYVSTENSSSNFAATFQYYWQFLPPHNEAAPF